jgi:hypothetical protein
MNLAAELSQFDPYKTSPETLAALLAKWAEQAKKDAGQIKKDAEKIAALSYELAWHKRLKFAARSEAMSAQQRDLFDESQAEDLQAIEAELEQLTPSAPRTKKKPIGRKPLPAELPRIDYRHEPDSCSCGACGQALVKIGEDITEQLDVEPARFLFSAIFVRNMPAVIVKPSQLRLFQPP